MRCLVTLAAVCTHCSTMREASHLAGISGRPNPDGRGQGHDAEGRSGLVGAIGPTVLQS